MIGHINHVDRLSTKGFTTSIARPLVQIVVAFLLETIRKQARFETPKFIEKGIIILK
jgi:hypothetical protein